jgi:hypothetical protein
MAEILLFHAAQGQTRGFHAFSDELRATGTPSIRRISSTDAPARPSRTGWRTPRSSASPARSSPVAPAPPRRSRTRSSTPGSRSASCRRRSSPRPAPARAAALLFYACVPAEFFGPWPAGVPVQIHGMEGRPDLRRRGRHRRGPRARRLGRGRRPLPRPGRSVPALSARSRWGAQAGVQPRAGDRPGRGSRHGPLGSICARFAGGRGRVAPVA